jgi:hypothetical protein
MEEDAGRKAKEKVRKKYPHSITVKFGPGLAVIKNLSRGEVKHADILGVGQTFDEAWINAARQIRD